MQPTLSHVALLVRSVQDSLPFCTRAKYEVGPVEEFPSEGTREVYIGSSAATGLLLLMEAIGPGPYRRALDKRGPGLHHVAINVPVISDYIAGLAGSGWLLHPASVQTLADRKTAYLARPGLHALIEVQQAGKPGSPDNAPSFITEVHIEGDQGHQRLLDALGLRGLRMTGRGGAGLVIGGKMLGVASIAPR